MHRVPTIVVASGLAAVLAGCAQRQAADAPSPAALAPLQCDPPAPAAPDLMASAEPRDGSERRQPAGRG
jgi:hypothetical protein